MKRYSLLNFPFSSDFTVELREMTYKVSAIFIIFCDLWYLPTACDLFCFKIIDSVQFSHSVVSNSLWPHELQYARPPCPPPTPGIYPNSCPLSRWCHLFISSSVVPFSSCLQSFPTSGSFQMSQLFASRGQNIGFGFKISPSNEHPRLISSRMTGWIFFLLTK